jgi:PAS domain S-box-containing protein
MLPSSLWPDIKRTVEANPHNMVTVIDQRELICYASPSSKKLFGYKRTEIIGRPFTDFFSAIDNAHIRLALEDAKLFGQSIEISRDVKIKAGGTRRMRGPAMVIADRSSGERFELAVGRPIE